VMRVETQIESTERELGQARELQRRLRLEVERLSAPRRIEQLALRAHMVRADRSTTPTQATKIPASTLSRRAKVGRQSVIGAPRRAGAR